MNQLSCRWYRLLSRDLIHLEPRTERPAPTTTIHQATRTVLVSSVMKPVTPLVKPACCSMAWIWLDETIVRQYHQPEVTENTRDVCVSSAISARQAAYSFPNHKFPKDLGINSPVVTCCNILIQVSLKKKLNGTAPPRKRCCRVLWEGQRCQWPPHLGGPEISVQKWFQFKEVKV